MGNTHGITIMGDFAQIISDQWVSKASHNNGMAYNKNCYLHYWDPAVFLVCWDAPYLCHLYFCLLNAFHLCMTFRI